MGCRCAERGQAIVAGVKAAVRGDVEMTKEALAHIAQTVRDDARDLRSRIAAGRQALIRR